MNLTNTLLVILTVNGGEFNQHTLTVDCSEFHEELRSEKMDGRTDNWPNSVNYWYMLFFL